MLNKIFAVSCALTLSACHERKPDAPKVEAETAPAPAAPAPVKKTYTALSRIDFNARAQEQFVPLFWRTDANKDGALDPAELVTLIGPWTLTLSELVKD